MRFPDWLPVYGDLSHRDPDCLVEEVEHIDFIAFLKEYEPEIYEACLHPKNEGKRSGRQSQKEKMLGALNGGASDIVIPGGPAFVCELKRADHTRSSWQPKQKEYLLAAKNVGAFVCVALGCRGAIQALIAWKQITQNTPASGGD